MTSRSSLETRWLSSISEADPDEWASMAGNNALASWPWLRTVEQTNTLGWEFCYLTVSRGGRLIGAALCQLHEEAYEDRMDSLVFGRAKSLAWKFRLSLAPALVCGPCGTYGAHLITRADLDPADRAGIEDALLDGLRDRAEEASLSLAFTHVLATQPGLIRKLQQRGMAQTLLSPMAQLEINWPDFDGYEKHVRRISRNALSNVRRERKRNLASGTQIVRLANPAAHVTRLRELLTMTTEKYSDEAFWYSDDYFAHLAENFGSKAIVYAAMRDETIIGVCVMVCSETDGYPIEIGIDHAMAGNDFSYFNLGYYCPIEDAMQLGLKRLHFDNALHELKARKGCQLVNDYLFYTGESGPRRAAVGALFTAHTRHFERKHAHLRKYPLLE